MREERRRILRRMGSGALALLLSLTLWETPAAASADRPDEGEDEPPVISTAEEAYLASFTPEELAAFKSGETYALALYAPYVDQLFAQTGGFAGGMLQDIDGDGSPELTLTWPVGNDWYYSVYRLNWTVKAVKQEGSLDPELRLTAIGTTPLTTEEKLYTRDSRTEAWVGSAGWTWEPPEPDEDQELTEEELTGKELTEEELKERQKQQKLQELWERGPDPKQVFATWQRTASTNVSDVTDIRIYHPLTMELLHTLHCEAVYTTVKRQGTVLSDWICDMDGMEFTYEEYTAIADCLTPLAVVYPGAAAQTEPRTADCWQRLEALRDATSGLPSAPADYIAPGVFLDVPMDSWFFSAVGWAFSSGITEGTGYGYFTPNRICSTPEVLTFLWREEGCPEPFGENPFSNLSEEDWYYKPVLWAYDSGLISGTVFPRSQECTRAALVTYLWTLAGKHTGAEIPFRDVPLDAPYAEAVGWALERGVTEGVSATEFNPFGVCTRAQVVTFLHRYDRMWLW